MRLLMLAGCALAISLWVAACGSSYDLAAGGIQPVINPAPDTSGEDPFADLNGKATSAAFRKFFLDSVNTRSHGRWTGWGVPENGLNSWWLTTFGEGGRNLLEINFLQGNVDQALTSVPFTVPAGRKGIKLGFTVLHQLEHFDEFRVELKRGSGEFEPVAIYTYGNPNDTGTNRYIVALPDAAASDEQWQIRFHLVIDSTFIAGGGVFLHSIAVYQTRLAPPVAYSLDDTENFASAHWNPGPGPKPDSYDVYTWDDNSNLGWAFNRNVPASQLSAGLGDDVGTGYHYRIVAKKDGYDDSEFSNDEVAFPHDPLGDFDDGLGL